MTTASNVSKVLAIYLREGIDCDICAGHDVIIFCDNNPEIYLKEELIAAGAFYSREFDSWAMYT